MESCVAELRSKETTANKGKFAQFADSCKSKAEEDFQERGGDMEELGLIKEEAQRKSMMEASRACINEDTNVKGKTLSGAAKETAYAAAAKACAAKEEEAFIAAGGNVQDLKVERQKKKSSAVRSSMESCVKNHADILALTRSTSKTDRSTAYKTATKACTDDAKNALVEAGGTVADVVQEMDKAVVDQFTTI